MLIKKRGKRLYNRYDLRLTLERQLFDISKELEKEIKGKIKNYTELIEKTVSKYRIAPLVFFTNKISYQTSKAMIPAEYFGSGYFVVEGQSYEKDVYTFTLPFSGDPILLESVPSTRILWTEDVMVTNNEIQFDLIKFSDSASDMKRELDRIVKYITDQGNNVNKQVEEYNNQLGSYIAEQLSKANLKIIKDKEFDIELGVPQKNIESSSITDNKLNVKKNTLTTKKYDVFISHASEDKNYVSELARELKEAGIEVWYDDFQLGWGDDLRAKIDDGLINSKFGIVVFSESFLNKKKWTEHEINALFAREVKGQKVILPIWHNINRDALLKYSPAFADRLAKKSNELANIIAELKKMLKR
jgi:hypothetical protein